MKEEGIAEKEILTSIKNDQFLIPKNMVETVYLIFCVWILKNLNLR